MTEQENNTAIQEPPVFHHEERIDASKLDLSEEVIQLNRVAKVVKGGRRFSFSALVVVGDRNGHVGIGFGKANEVPESIQKGMQDGRKNLIKVPRIGTTLPYTVIGEYGSARVLLRPASPGTGLIAGPAIRTVLELAGLHDVLTKSLGSSNVINILKAVVQGLGSVQDAEEVARLRGRNLEEIVGVKRTIQLRQGADGATPGTAEEKTETKREDKNKLVVSTETPDGTESPGDAALSAESAEEARPDESARAENSAEAPTEQKQDNPGQQ